MIKWLFWQNVIGLWSWKMHWKFRQWSYIYIKDMRVYFHILYFFYYLPIPRPYLGPLLVPRLRLPHLPPTSPRSPVQSQPSFQLSRTTFPLSLLQNRRQGKCLWIPFIYQVNLLGWMRVHTFWHRIDVKSMNAHTPLQFTLLENILDHLELDNFARIHVEFCRRLAVVLGGIFPIPNL